MDAAHAVLYLLERTSDLLAPSDGDKVLGEGPFHNFYGDDPTDYICGRVVLARKIYDERTQALLRSNDRWRDILSRWDAVFEKTASVIYQETNGVSTPLYPPDWNEDGNKAAFEEFYNKYGKGSRDLEGWPDFDDAGYHNYCCMNAFDIYAAF